MDSLVKIEPAPDPWITEKEEEEEEQEEEEDEEEEQEEEEEEEEQEEEQEEQEEEEEEVKEEEDDEMTDPLDIGGFLTPVNPQPIDPPTLVHARDLTVGQAILINNQPFDIISRSDSRAQSGALASRHKVTLKLVELFDKGPREPLVVKATEEMKRVHVARVRYNVVCMLPQPDDGSCCAVGRGEESRENMELHIHLLTSSYHSSSLSANRTAR